MANSKYEYVRDFERDENMLPNTWIVVRIDGRGFHKLSHYYNFSKPNDPRALRLMNYAASHVVQSLPDIILAYGVSDEFSFVFHRSTTLFERRKEKIITTVVSAFTAAYVLGWDGCFLGDEAGAGKEVAETDGRPRKLSMEMLPTFDGRAVCYPSWENLRDYLRWRQVDCHINNLYNTTFWALVQQGGMTQTAAEEFLKGTVSADKNEILWSRFGVNYNNEPEMSKKGSVVFREYALRSDVEDTEKDTRVARTVSEDEAEDDVALEAVSKTQAEKMRKSRRKAKVVTQHVDIIRDLFWNQRPWLRTGKPGAPVTENPTQDPT